MEGNYSYLYHKYELAGQENTPKLPTNRETKREYYPF
jgi:hypothetical protein